jgi:TolA-binding protein
VKIKNATKAPVVLFLLCNIFFFNSCSSIIKHHGQTLDSTHPEDGKNTNVTVPKEQYDELARKYQELITLSKYNMTKNFPSTSVADEHNSNSNEQIKPQVGNSSVIDPSELVNRIDTTVVDTAKIDSVDALNSETQPIISKGPPMPNSIGVQNVNNTDDIDDQIVKLREAQDLVKTNNFEKGITILKELENSKEKQIVVRSKIMLGDLLFNQGEYDLASQVYEEVIKKHAFSGFVLKALGKLVSCSEKLKQPEKQAKYYSLLHDFFEAS